MRAPISRRAVLAGAGGLVVGFMLTPAIAAEPEPAAAPVVADDIAADQTDSPPHDAWLRIGADGRATLFTGKVELGHGLLTALAQIAAEELDLPVDHVTVISGDTERVPNEGATTGSRSIETTGAALRQAGATLRALLVDRAAERLDVPADRLTVRDGVVTAPDGRSLDYAALASDGDLHSTAPRRVDAPAVRPKPAAERRIVGTAVPRRDLPAKVTGAARFVQDMTPDGLLYGRVVRPPRYGAVLDTVDADAVKDLPGIVVLVRDGSFLGVLAEREEQAVRARAALRRATTWSGGTTLPAPDRLWEHLRTAPAETHVIDQRGDDVASAPAGAVALTASYRKPYVAHAAIAPPAAVAVFDDGFLTVWTASQDVFALREALGAALHMPASDIRCIHAETGGSFGQDGADDAALDAALLARAVPGRPVRLQWERDETFAWSPFGPAMMVDLAGQVGRDGRIATWSHTVWSNTHAMRPGDAEEPNLLAAWQLDGTAEAAPPRTAPATAGGGAERNAVPPYDLPRRRIVEHRVLDMPLRVSALRSLGAFANVFASESFMDELARAAGADPLAFRLAHLSDVHARAVLEAAARRAGWPGRRGGNRPGLGIGFARYRDDGAHVAAVAEIAVDRRSGAVRVVRVVVAVDAGTIVNPDGAAAQIEGGVIQATSWTLREAVRFDATGITSRSFADYPILTMPEVPSVDVVLIDRPEAPSRGVGEAALGPTAAAIANAVAAATGARIRELPLTPARVLAALAASPSQIIPEKRRRG
ncbi:MAG: xanthine dehydrogenase family protein molybdopterin-binding subunit [Rhodovulum sp.]|nr:xanthine dehydrogenase family protein molybdopterin-binding subunit [Rhodovulum sp.]